MSDSNVNPFENTNSGPSVLAPQASEATGPTAGCQKGGVGRWIGRAFLYAPVLFLAGTIAAFAAFPQLTEYASPVLKMIDPGLDDSRTCSDDAPHCCPNSAAAMTASAGSESCCPLSRAMASASAKKSCCASAAPATELTSIEVSDEIASEEVASDQASSLPSCCHEGSDCCEGAAPCSESADGVCPLAKARAAKAAAEAQEKATEASETIAEESTPAATEPAAE